MDDKQAKMAKAAHQITIGHIENAFKCPCKSCTKAVEATHRALEFLSGPLAEFAFAEENTKALKRTASVAAILSEHTFNMLALQCFEEIDDMPPHKAAEEFKRIADFYRTRVEHFDAKFETYAAKATPDAILQMLGKSEGIIVLPMIEGRFGKVDLSGVPEDARPAIQKVIDEIKKRMTGGRDEPPESH